MDDVSGVEKHHCLGFDQHPEPEDGGQKYDQPAW